MLPEQPVDVGAAEAALTAAAHEWRAAIATHTEAARLAFQLDDACEAAGIAYEAIAQLADEAAVIERLANSVAGRAPNTLKMNLETFVLAAELEEIVAAANLRLDEKTQGRYRLQHTHSRAARGAASGLGIEVLDAYTGHARPVQSLSGGETFLASLALALGLAEVVTARAGGIRLDTLFIDEGFGSLDADSLEIAMRTLDELRQGGRVIGVISHVETMKDQLPAQLLVEATDQGPSVIRQEAGALT
jgi:exonuclease SbcC